MDEIKASILTDRFSEALAHAVAIHAHQRRKGSDLPYVSHLLGVTSLALEYGADENEAIAALLHDAIEDVGAHQREEIRRRFGGHVLEIVEGCTDADTVPKPPWRERKERYVRHVREAPPSVRLVSAADKLHNARALLKDYREVGEDLWGRFNNGGKADTLWYYEALVEAFDGLGPIREELARTVGELRRISTEGEGGDGVG